MTSTNLLSWQVAVELGCPWDTEEACAEFERAVSAIGAWGAGGAASSSASAQREERDAILKRLSERQRQQLEAAEMHRWWMAQRGCPCGGALHCAPGILAPCAALQQGGGKRKRAEEGQGASCQALPLEPRFCMRSSADIAALYKRGASVVWPYLLQWSASDDDEKFFFLV